MQLSTVSKSLVLDVCFAFIKLYILVGIVLIETADAQSCTEACQEATETGLRPLTEGSEVLCCCVYVNGECVERPEIECEAPYIPKPDPTLLPDA